MLCTYLFVPSVRSGGSSLVNAGMQIRTVQSCTAAAQSLSFGAPPHIFLLFDSFLLYVQAGSAASIQVEMQIEAAACLKSTLSDLTALEISRTISFGAPPAHIFK